MCKFVKGVRAEWRLLKPKIFVIATQYPVIASAAKQSPESGREHPVRSRTRLPRHFVPRNDEGYLSASLRSSQRRRLFIHVAALAMTGPGDASDSSKQNRGQIPVSANIRGNWYLTPARRIDPIVSRQVAGYSACTGNSSAQDHCARESQKMRAPGCIGGSSFSVPAEIITPPICGTTRGIGLPHCEQKQL